MFAAPGRRRVNKLCIGGLVKDSEGGLKVPLLLLLHHAKGRRSLVLSPGKPVACPEAFLGSPNGSKDHVLKEFLLEGKAPLRLHNKVNRDVNLKAGLGEVL